MIDLSSRITKIKPSKIIEISQKAKQLKDSGLDIISFSVGVPNFLPAKHVYDAVENSLKDDKGTYLSSRGESELINAYINKLNNDNITGFKPEHIATGCGAKHILFNLMISLLNKDDEVILIAPTWGTYIDNTEFFDAKPVIIECEAKDDFKLNPDDLDKYITDKTKMIIFNNPTNPTGMVYTKDEVSKIAKKLEKYPNVWVISDDIYDNMIYDDLTFEHLFHYANDDLKKRMILVNSISKTYGMPGWRVGYLACLDERISKAISSLNANSVTNIAQSSIVAATAALNGDQSFVKDQCLKFVSKRDLVMKHLSSVNGIICPKPQGAFYAFIDISSCFNKHYSGKLINDSMDFCKILLDEKLLACIPGDVFASKNCIRISYACDTAKLEEGLLRLVSFIKEIK